MSQYKEKNIYFIIPTLEGGGAERVIASIARSFSCNKELKSNITVIVLIEEEIKIDNTNFKLLRLNSKTVSRSFFILLKYLFLNRPDVVLSTLKHVTFITSIACKILNIPHFSRVANTVSIETDKSNKWKFLSKINYMLDRGVVAVSEGVKRDLIKNNLATSKKIQVIPNPVLIPKLWTAEPIRTEKSHIKALYVGRLVQQKNVEFLIKMVALKKGKIHLDIVGDGNCRYSLQEIAKNLDVCNYIRFVGHTNDVNKFYNQSDVLLLSSHFEGMPNVLLEALCTGIPVVTYDCPSGPSEIVKSPLLGSLVSKLDENYFYDCIRREYDNDNKIKRHYRRKWVKDNFHIKNISNQYYDFITGYEA